MFVGVIVWSSVLSFPLPLIFVVAGLSLAVAPLPAARFASRLRFVPYSDDPAYVLRYRRAGILISLLGLAWAAVLG